jgi:hypothetical protein
VNAEAHALKTTRNGHRRISKATNPTAEPDCVVFVSEVLVAGGLERVLAPPLTVDDPPDVDEPPEFEFPPPAPPAALKTGAAIALEGSTSAPVPQRMVSPAPVTSFSSGGTLDPSAPATMNRVTQVTLVVPGAVNW